MDENPVQPVPNPAPVPIVYPKKTIKDRLIDLVFASVPACLVGVALVAYYERKAPPPYRPPVAAAAKLYYEGIPIFYHRLADQIRGGVYPDKDGAIKAIKDNATPFSQALDEAIRPFCDQQTGKFTNSSGASDVIDEASKAMGAKF